MFSRYLHWGTDMLERFKLLVKLEEKEGNTTRALRHLALTTNGMEAWAKANKKPIQEAYKQSFAILKDLVEL